MDTDIVGDMIFHLHYNSITLSSNDAWAWELSIYSHHGLCMAQSSYVLHTNLLKQNIYKNHKYIYMHELNNHQVIYKETSYMNTKMGKEETNKYNVLQTCIVVPRNLCSCHFRKPQKADHDDKSRRRKNCRKCCMKRQPHFLSHLSLTFNPKWGN